IGSRPELSDLSSTPYYCDLLAGEHRAGKLKDSYSESQLLRDAISSILNREYDKGLLDRDLVPEDEVMEFLEALAAEDMAAGFEGVGADKIKLLAQVILPPDLGPTELERFPIHLSQLALFSQGTSGVAVRFAHEILEQCL